MNRDFRALLEHGEIVDLFAGGGGFSSGCEEAHGRHVTVAINHNPVAISIHTVNHKKTKHYISDVFEVDPVEATGGRPVLTLHLSPDCTHHSQSRGGQPRNKKIRALSWVALKWAGKTHPAILTLENVVQLKLWGRLVAKRDQATGRVVKLDGTVAGKGERVPVHEQFLVPDKRAMGKTWNRFVNSLRKMGYQVEYRSLKACDYGAPTSRERLFLVARNDGLPITWPKPTHGNGPGLLPYRTAAECIDWSIPCPSIFERKKPLADATLRRIAKGIQKYVLDSNEPFIVNTVPPAPRSGGERANNPGTPPRTAATQDNLTTVSPVIVPIQHYGHGDVAHNPTEPLRTITANPKGGSFALAVPVLVEYHSEKTQTDNRTKSVDTPLPVQTTENRFGLAIATLSSPLSSRQGENRRDPVGKSVPTATDSVQHAVTAAVLARQFGRGACTRVDAPLGTVTTHGKTGWTAVYLEQANTGVIGHDAREPLSTITASGVHQRLAAVTLVCNTTGHDASRPDEPLDTVTTGNHHAVVEAVLDPQPATDTAKAAFLSHFRTSNTCGGDGKLDKPVTALTAGGMHQGLVECALSPEAMTKGAERMAAFMIKYYGTGGQWSRCNAPMQTVTAKARMGLVTVTIRGTVYHVVDVGLRMLSPRELFRAQGFSENYVIDKGAEGEPISKTDQVRLCGNSVCPPLAHAVVKANLDVIKAAAAQSREAA